MRCRSCLEDKPATEMVKDSRLTLGISTRCKACMRRDNANRIASDRTRHNANRRAARAADPVPTLLAAAKARAMRQGVPFNLVLTDIVIPKHCPVLGIELVFGQGTVSPASPTLDKIVPRLGYVRGNFEVISHMANRIKSNATPEQLRRVADYYTKQGEETGT